MRRVLPAAAVAALASAALLAAPAPALGAGDAAAGKVTYDRYCAQCHGADGLADGPGADRMLPRPRIFRDNISYKFRSTPSGELPTSDDLFRSITEGLPGTGMPAWGHLSEQDRWNLVAWIETTTEEFVDPMYAAARVPLPDLAQAPPERTDALVARGAEVYTANECAKCHGTAGRGDGPSWDEQFDDWAVPIDPADFTSPSRFRGGDSAAAIFRTISTGVSGTPMPAFADTIPAEDRWALTWYLKSLSEDPAGPEDWDRVVVAERREAFDPEAAGAWDDVPAATLRLGPQLVRSPRLFWPSVVRVHVQAVYTADEIFLRARWNDREASTGTDLAGSYEDPFVGVLRDAPHPDRVALTFAPGEAAPGEPLPSFLTGDGKRPADAWLASAIAPALVEQTARGVVAMTDKAASTVSGSMAWADGVWTVVARRPRTTDRPRADVQLGEAGVHVPFGLSVWDGSRGEAGARRSVSPWYSLYLAPEPSALASVVPVGKAGLGLLLLLALGGIVRRWPEAAGGPPSEPTNPDRS